MQSNTFFRAPLQSVKDIFPDSRIPPAFAGRHPILFPAPGSSPGWSVDSVTPGGSCQNQDRNAAIQNFSQVKFPNSQVPFLATPAGADAASGTID